MRWLAWIFATALAGCARCDRGGAAVSPSDAAVATSSAVSVPEASALATPAADAAAPGVPWETHGGEFDDPPPATAFGVEVTPRLEVDSWDDGLPYVTYKTQGLPAVSRDGSKV